MNARFDGTAAWRELSAEAMEAIGALALELVAGWKGQDRAYEDADTLGDGAAPLHRAACHAEQLIVDQLHMAFTDHVGEEKLNTEDGTPLLPSIIGPVCRVCGCSQTDACQPFSCHWVEPDLCSACAPAGAQA